MRLPELGLRMLRYRVALMLWMFMLLGAASGAGNGATPIRWIAAVALLGFSYIAATSVNDLSDERIDSVNHPGDPGRPLVTGEASRRDMWLIHSVALAATIACGVALGGTGVLVAGVSLTIAYAYSARPVTLSHRTYLAPVILSVAYVLVPFFLGRAVVGSGIVRADTTLLAGLFLLFLSRITLKDFRDRAGDARYGRPTLLLRFGKSATCAVSLVALLTGDLLVTIGLDAPAAVAALLQVLVAAIAWMLRALWLTPDPRTEQIAIGLGAKMGNGFLIAGLSWLLLRRQGAQPAEAIAFVALVALGYLSVFVRLATDPAEVVIGYKG